ncbi:acyltransferase family protein [uncultured Methylobacterium sp.]|uniref:acyltransferase family protein n=1 Tax=uncultured Methylobacterium sp. TaxID=157278 RepID=UPI0035CAB11F
MPHARQIPNIQILRAAAALLVAMHHAQFEAAALALRTGQAFAPSSLLPWAAGVDVFFVVSGFIIVHAAGALTAAPGGRSRFLVHRAARVVPLYWLVTALYLAVALTAPASVNGTGVGLDPRYVAASFLFWPAARPDGAVLPLYGLGWTLNCEMAFYLLFAIGLGRGRQAAVAWISGCLSALVLAGAWFAPSAPALAFWSNPVMLEFGLGALIALARGADVRLSRPARTALALGALALLARAGRADAFPEGFLRPLALGVPAALLVGAAALGATATDGEPGRRTSPIMSAFAAIGDASYALYLVHPFVLRGLNAALARLGLAIAPWTAIALMLGLSIVAALLVFRLVERPMTRLIRARLDARAGLRENRVCAALPRVSPRRDPH